MLLWPLCAMPVILSLVRYGFPSLSEYGLVTSFHIHPLFSIVMHTCALLLGLCCAQKIGAKLLFLDGDYNFKKDILKPAVIAGVIFAGIFLANVLRSDSFLNYVYGLSFGGVFEWFIDKLFYSLRMDLFTLLFGICGLAFIIKKVAKNVAISSIIPISIGLMTIVPYLPLLFDCIMRGFSSNIPFLISSLWKSAEWLLIALLFWKKGLEAALACEMVIVTIIYLIAPLVILAIGA